MSQAELAEKLGTKQSAVARLEDVTYGRHSLAVLHKLAEIFDVAAWVEFVPYSTFVRRTADLSPAAITPASYRMEFDEEGEPNTSVDLRFDGSPICISHYVVPVSGNLFLSSPDISRGTTGQASFEVQI